MKLNFELLKSLIDLPTENLQELRPIFDDLALEVEGFEELDGQVFINIETLAQRGDHLSALGVAREIHGRFGTAISFPKLADLPKDQPLDRQVKIKTEYCLNYALIAAEADKSLKLPNNVSSRLLEVKADKHPLVNISNYVLAELGQPTHVFDKAKIDGDVEIVLSKEIEEIEALDGKTYQVPKDSILIRDQKKTIAVAGVIGCANSAISKDTQQILIESADFDPVHVRKTARKMGISTEASYAFERGIDYNGQLSAVERIFSLGNLKGKGFYFSANQREARKIKLNLEQFQRNFNQPELEIAQVNKYLEQLVPKTYLWNY